MYIYILPPLTSGTGSYQIDLEKMKKIELLSTISEYQ
jgi:hypothetical protein